MICKKNIYSLKLLILAIVAAISIISLTGCAPCEECTDIRLKLEEDGYLTGWVYLKDINSLDDEGNPAGRILFALYENEEKPEEHAVLKITKLTVPNSYNGYFVGASYDNSSNTAKSLENNKYFNFTITYDSSGIKINNE